MRIKSALIVLLIAVASTGTVSVTGQEEPMPRVIPVAGFAPDVATVALVVEPVRDVQPPTLSEAARNNDFVTFDALFRAAKERGEPVAAYETLHELWVYSVSDPIGAFYGAETRDRLARAYPGYAAFIEDLRVVDDRGNAYYPTSETRAFLLSRANDGIAPRVMIASNRVAAETHIAESRERTAETPNSAPVRTQPAKSHAAQRAVAKTTAVVSAPVVASPIVAPPVVAEPVASATVPTPQPVAAAPAPVVSTPVVNSEAAPSSAPENPAVVPASPVETTAPIARQNVFRSRGILLLVMGLVGIGLLAVMLRTPRESTPMSIMPPAAPPEKPVVPVEPLHRSDSARKTG